MRSSTSRIKGEKDEDIITLSAVVVVVIIIISFLPHDSAESEVKNKYLSFFYSFLFKLESQVGVYRNLLYIPQDFGTANRDIAS